MSVIVSVTSVCNYQGRSSTKPTETAPFIHRETPSVSLLTGETKLNFMIQHMINCTTADQPEMLARERQPRYRQDGFTMIELMVVVAILAALASLAAPSFRDMVEGYRVRQAIEEMTSTVYFARSEAIKRGGNISVRRNCATGDADDWDCGWIVFTDADNNGSLNGTDVILQTFPILNNMNVVNIGGGAFFRVNRWGQPNSLGAASFAINPKPTGVSSRHASALCMSSGGRLRVEKNTATCA